MGVNNFPRAVTSYGQDQKSDPWLLDQKSSALSTTPHHLPITI